jgi:8-oxo-dGTP pyrophosphatase MutT (NUDIX family)
MLPGGLKRLISATVTASASGKKISVGALVLDEHGRLLLVNPSYKDRWDLPGGILERHEDPVAGLVREVREELGVECRVGELRAVDYGRSDWEGAEVIMLTFSATLTPADPARFRLAARELLEAAYVEVERAFGMVTPRMSDRLSVALGLVPPGPHGILVDRPLKRGESPSRAQPVSRSRMTPS